jgi:xanthosine utilization system XapX-like protein
MAYSQQNAFALPSTWLELNDTAVELLFAVSLVVGSASLLAMASGDPEVMALVALTGFTVLLVGTTLVRLSEHLRTNGVSLP